MALGSTVVEVFGGFFPSSFNSEEHFDIQANSSLSFNSQSYLSRDIWFRPCFKQLSKSYSVHALLAFPPNSLSSRRFIQKGRLYFVYGKFNFILNYRSLIRLLFGSLLLLVILRICKSVLVSKPKKRQRVSSSPEGVAKGKWTQFSWASKSTEARTRMTSCVHSLQTGSRLTHIT